MELMERRRILLNTPHINIVTGLQFVTDMVAPIESLVINFSPIQDLHGYDSPWPAGGGKNLFDKTANDTNNGYISGKYIKSDGTAVTPLSGIEWNTSEYIPVLPNTQYTLSGLSTVSSSAPSIAEYNSNKEFITARPYANNPSITITTNASTNWVRVSIQQDNINGIQLEVGSTVTSYAPYSNICPISGRTGLDVTRTGKNLANMFNDGKYPSISNGQLVNGNSLRSDYISMDGDTQITFSGNTSSTIYCFFYDSGKNFIYFNANTSPLSVTTPSNTAYVMLRAAASATSLQLEFGSTATAYEPYNATTLSIDWTDEAGTVYGGTLNPITGVLTATHKFVTYDGSQDEGWTVTAVRDYYRYQIIPSDIYNIGQTSSATVLCNIGKSDATEALYNVRQYQNRIWYGTTVPTVEAWREYLAETNMQVVYPLATPLTYQLTPQQIRTVKGTNNLLSNSNGGMTVNYWTHLD